MSLFKLFCLLAVVSSVVANPLPGEEPAETTVSVTVTVTATTSAAVTPIPNPATEVPVITRTFTVTAWTKTTTLVSELNCTRTVLTGGTPARTTPSRLPPQPTPSLFGRQNATSIVAPTTARPSTPIPTLVPSRRRTRTSWAVTTVTPSGDLRRTRYECGNTLTYIYTVDATTTQWLTITSYPNVVTSTSLIACFPPAGGRPPIPTGGGVPTRRPPVPTSSLASVTLTAPPLPPTPPIFKRQNATASAVGFKNATVTLHITSTLYSFTTTVNNSTTTALGWACSPFSTSVVLSTTIAAPAPEPTPPSAPLTSIIPVTTSVTVLPRPSAPAGSSAVGTNLSSVILTLTRPPLPTVSETPPTVLPSPSPVKPTE